MCEFVSYIKKGNKVLFLTNELVFHTEKGKKLQEWCKNNEDYTGHGAIRWYYGLEQDIGEDHECADFSTPDNFPDVIVRAIKNGKFRGIGSDSRLLSEAAWVEYEKVCGAALAEYEEVCGAARAEYEEVCDDTFWDLFDIPGNRNPNWK